eukprot:3993195-Prymnesium_polylepis.1
MIFPPEHRDSVQRHNKFGVAAASVRWEHAASALPALALAHPSNLWMRRPASPRSSQPPTLQGSRRKLCTRACERSVGCRNGPYVWLGPLRRAWGYPRESRFC